MTLALVFILLLVIGLPIGFVLLGAAVFFAFESGRIAFLGAFPAQMYGSLEIFDLLAIPLFILLGEVMAVSGIASRMFSAAHSVLRRVPKSLAVVTLVSNFFLAAIIGSANAQVAVMSRVAIPEMEKRGYSRVFATGLTCGASLLGPLIPPSMIFIIYAVVAQVSIGAMFLAGAVPGLLLFLLLLVVIAISGEREHAAENAPEPGARSTTTDRLGILGALAIPVVVVGSILGGFATPTESAAIAVLIALLVSWMLFRWIPLGELFTLLVNTALNSAIVLFLIATARVFGYILTLYQVPQYVSDFMISLSSSPTTFLLIVIVLLLVVGTVIEGIAALIILLPVLLPVATGVYGLDPIAFGVIFCLALMVGLITPPVGTVLYIAAAISRTSIGRLSVAVLPFIGAALVVLLLLVYFPSLGNAFR